jgi:hypothetical protein
MGAGVWLGIIRAVRDDANSNFNYKKSWLYEDRFNVFITVCVVPVAWRLSGVGFETVGDGGFVDCAGNV